MKKSIFALSLLATIVAFGQKKNTTKKETVNTSKVVTNYTDDQKMSYYIGVNIAKNMKSQGLNVDINLLTQAFKDILGNKTTLLPEADANNFIQSYMQKVNEKKQAEMKAKAEENKKTASDFLAKNKENPNIKSTESGIQYEIISEGDVTKKPSAKDIVTVKYTGKLLNGSEFDSTEKNGGQPAEFPLNRVIKGWSEGLQLMGKGAKYKFYIPSDLGYGDRGKGDAIPPGSLLIFEVELIDFKAPEVKAETTKPIETLPPTEKKEATK